MPGRDNILISNSKQVQQSLELWANHSELICCEIPHPSELFPELSTYGFYCSLVHNFNTQKYFIIFSQVYDLRKCIQKFPE
jgi:hypothetical protein